MKLWMKLTAISLIVTTAILSISMVFILSAQSASLRNADEENARSALRMYCMNITSVVGADTAQIQTVTLRSIVEYYFSFYARSIQGSDTYYSLAQNDKYLFNSSPYDPISAFPKEQIMSLDHSSDNAFSIHRVSTTKGNVIISACSFEISGQVFDAYICMNVSQTDNQIVQMRLICLSVLFTACLMLAILTAVFMYRALRPIEQLTNSASEIASGDYSIRTQCSTKDEIGALSGAFDHMADTLVEKINSLDELVKKQRLLLGALTHELKTPMTAIIGYSDSLMSMPLVKEQQVECVKKIHDAGKRTEALSQKMMELVGLAEDGGIQKREFDALDFVALLKEFANPRVRFSCDSSILYGDETMIFSMVMNLIDNAIKASIDEEAVNVDIHAKDRMTSITVTDMGKGIPAEHLSLITEPFYRVDKARARKDGGAGIGLALCKMIAEKHGGELSIKSEPGKGTQVTATLLQFDDNLHTTC